MALSPTPRAQPHGTAGCLAPGCHQLQPCANWPACVPGAPLPGQGGCSSDSSGLGRAWPVTNGFALRVCLLFLGCIQLPGEGLRALAFLCLPVSGANGVAPWGSGLASCPPVLYFQAL